MESVLTVTKFGLVLCNPVNW